MTSSTCPHCGQALPGGNHHPKAWTTVELQILKEQYPLGGARAVQRLLPERSLAAIQAFASKHGVTCRRKGAHLWSKRQNET